MGVPVAKVTPFPPVSSSIYWHLANISEDFCASVWAIPATFRIFVYRNKFLYAWLSSTNNRSTPSSSKVTTLSFLELSFSFCRRTDSIFFDFSICLMVYCSPFSALASSIATWISSISLSMVSLWRFRESGIFSNWLWPMITASYSPMEILEQNFFRLAGSKSFFVAARILAPGYSRKKSPAHCSVRWFGTTKRLF